MANVEKTNKRDLFVEKKSFTNDKNEKVDFMTYTLEINGTKIGFSPKVEDKKLLNFLLADKVTDKGLKLPLSIEKKSFKNDKGESIDFNAYTVDISGQVISLYPKTEDKKLCQYLLKDLI